LQDDRCEYDPLAQVSRGFIVGEQGAQQADIIQYIEVQYTGCGLLEGRENIIEKQGPWTMD
jgi:hypothetical protein